MYKKTFINQNAQTNRGKMGKGHMNFFFLKFKWPINLERYLASSVTREMQIKMRYIFLQVLVKIKKTTQ